MKKFTHWIVSTFIKDHQNIHSPHVRAQYGFIEGWTSIVINLILFIIKITAGLAIQSISLIADAVHTLSDSATSIVIIVGFKMAKKPSDKEHPFGHGRIESVTALIVAVLLFITSFELFKKSFYNILHPQTTTSPIGVILLIIATLIIKELLARFSFELGVIIDSKALKADALHHRSDAISTIFVVVALIASRFGYQNIDGIMGIFVSLIVFYSAYSIAKEAIDPLLGEAPSKKELQMIEQIAMNHTDIYGVHDIIFHKYGQTSIISLHIEVSDKENVTRLHTLSERVEDAIAKKMGGMVVTHIDPINHDHPQYKTIHYAIGTIVAKDTRVHSFHELRIIGDNTTKCRVIFDIALEENIESQQTPDIIYSLREEFKHHFPEMKLIIKAEPRYVYNL